MELKETYKILWEVSEILWNNNTKDIKEIEYAAMKIDELLTIIKEKMIINGES